MSISETDNRLRIRHDVVFAKTGDGVLVRHSEGGFILRSKSVYDWLTTLSPFLDGTHTRDELLKDLDESRASMVSDLVDVLYDRGVVTEVSGRVIGDDDELAPYRAQIAYIDHYVGDGVRRFEDFRAARVRVDGVGLVADSLREGLALNGLATLVDESADLPDSELNILVVSAEDGDVARVGHAVRSSDAPRILPVVRWGDKVIIGPMTGKDADVDWFTAMARLSRNGDPTEATVLWRSLALGGSAAGSHALSPAHSSMIGLSVAYEVFRTLTGALPPETANGILCFDLVTGDTTLETILPDPFTGGARPGLMDLDLDLTVPEIAEAPTHRDRDSTEVFGPGDGILDDNRTPLERETMSKYFTLIGRLAGLVTDFDDEHLEQSPVKVSTAIVPTDSGTRAVRGFAVDTLGDARRDAVERGVLEYATALGPVPRDAVTDADNIPASRVFTWSGLVAADDESLHGGWTVGRTLDSRIVKVPTAAVYARSAVNAAGMFEHTGAGEGAGSTPAEAVRAGLRSASEYAALVAALRGAPINRLDDEAHEATRTYLQEAAHILGFELEYLLLPTVGPEPVALVREVGSPLHAVASAPTVDEAVAAALLRFLGRCQQPEGVASHDELLIADLDVRALVADGAPSALSQTDPATVHSWRSSLAAAHLDAVLVDITPADVAASGALTAVRVVLSRMS